MKAEIILCPKCNNDKIKIMAIGPSITYGQVVMACRCVKCQANFPIDPKTRKII